MEKKKIALLDTDFIFKTHISQSTSDHLIDKVLTLPDYRFLCHAQILKELSLHTEEAQKWLEGKILSEDITCYSDSEILDKLETVYGSSCCFAYLQFLKDACNAFGAKHFDNYYSPLVSLDYTKINKQDFLAELVAADNNVGRQNSLGEIKTYVLLQMLSLIHGTQVYLFCSDDGKARRGITQYEGVSCISFISALAILKDEIGLTKALAQPYCDSWLDFCAEHNQINCRVLIANVQRQFCKVPWAQVIQDVYDDRFVVLADGNLKYKTES